MKITILTFFPEIFKSYFESVAPLKKAIGSGKLVIDIMQIRDFTLDKHNRCDDTPYGGGAGLVLFCQPIVDAVKSIKDAGRVIFTSPIGKKLDHDLAVEFSKEVHLIIVAGRYEGYDNRIFDFIDHDKVSVGDYVITGGELAGLIIIDSAIRHVEGVLENPESLTDESFNEGLLEYDHYTKPREYMGKNVPEVLLSGHHKKIAEERHRWALINTYEYRPDLLKDRRLLPKELDNLKEYVKEKYCGKHSGRNEGHSSTVF